MVFINDVFGIAQKYKKRIEESPEFTNSKSGNNLSLEFVTRERYLCYLLGFDSHSPFVCTGKITTKKGKSLIGYDEVLIEKLGLENDEIIALALHEIGHLLYEGDVSDSLNKELFCDKFAGRIIGYIPIINALKKVCEIQSDEDTKQEISERIYSLEKCCVFYRPLWVVGRYNKKHHVALVYNLISGDSHFFKSDSADVVEFILKTDRSSVVNITDIVNGTNISEESIIPFFIALVGVGLVTTEQFTGDELKKYRNNCATDRKKLYLQRNNEGMQENEGNDAEQCYFDVVEKERSQITTAMLELTYSCSERCIHCYNPGAIRDLADVCRREERTEMDIDDYKRIIDELVELGLVKLVITGGDPFSKPIVWDILEYVYKKNIAFDVYTNGLGLYGKVDRLAGLFPHSVGISIYSGIAEDHDAITRVKGSWSRSLNVAKQLSELSVPLELKCCIMQSNVHSYYLVKDIAEDLGACMQFEINIVDSSDGDKFARQLRLTQDQLEIILRDPNLGVYVGLDAPNLGRRLKLRDYNGCKAGGHAFCITPEGNLQPCCTFPLVLGNVNNDTIANIVSNNRELEKWRNCTLEDYSECLKYDYCEYCTMCPGQGYIQHKDYLKPADGSCFIAKSRYRLIQKLKSGDDPLKGRNVYEVVKELPKYAFVLGRVMDKG